MAKYTRPPLRALLSKRARIADEHRRRAASLGLSATLTSLELKEILELFDYKCPLTGSENLSLDHFVSMSTGHMGTVYGNIIPMDRTLNFKKNNQNPYEWIQKVEHRVNMNGWYKILFHLAKANGMSLKTFREFVYWCYEEPRTYEDIQREMVDSVELFKRKTPKPIVKHGILL